MSKLGQLIFCGSLVVSSNIAFAELKELDDKSLDDQKGQAGITIDLEFEFSIGELAWDFSEGKDIAPAKAQKYSVTVPPRIEYVLPERK